MNMFSLLTGWRGHFIIAAAASVLAAAVSFYVTDAVGARHLAEAKAAFAQYRANTERASRKASEAARTEESAWQTRINALQTTFDEEARDAETHEKELRAAVLSGARKLRIAGLCPGGFGTGAKSASATSSGDATSIELAPAARRIALDLREAIRKDQRILNACQAYAKEVSQMQ